MSKIRVNEIVDVVDEGSPDLPHGATCAEPTADNHVATKSYVDSMLSGGFANTVSSTAPANAAIGSFWVDNSTNYNVLKCWNGSAWEEFSGMVGGISYLMGIVDPEIQRPINKSGYEDIPYIPSTGAITNISKNGGGLATAALDINGQHQDIAYGDGKFVVVNRRAQSSINSHSNPDRRVMYSSDGINWIKTDHAEANWWSGVTYGNGKFVAVSRDGTNRVMWSTDAITWNSASAAGEEPWSKVTYGEPNGQPTFVAIAGNSNSSGHRSMYSYDGINWQSSPTSDDTNNWTDVAYGNGKFVAVASSGVQKAMYSTDGINWTSGASGLLSAGYISIAYGEPNGQPTFVTVPDAGFRAHYSHDGINWTMGSVPLQANWTSVAYGEPNGQGTYLAIAEDSDDDTAGYTMYSHDGINWVNRPGAANPSLSVTYQWGGPVVFGGDKFIKIATWAMSSSANKIVGYSYDGISWTNPGLTLTLEDDRVRMLDTGELIHGETIATILNGGELLYDVDSYTNPAPPDSSGITAFASGNYSPGPGGASNMITLLNPYVRGDWAVGMSLRSQRTVTVDYPPHWPIWDTASSSIPTVSKGAISKWGIAEWQLAEDSAFTTNLQTVKTNIVRDIPQTPPSDLIIEANKEYYIRVRYGSLEPAISYSNWSPANVFKTELVSFPPIGASPWTDPNTGATYTYIDGVWYGAPPTS